MSRNNGRTERQKMKVHVDTVETRKCPQIWQSNHLMWQMQNMISHKKCWHLCPH